jgi:hypothetical protein
MPDLNDNKMQKYIVKFKKGKVLNTYDGNGKKKNNFQENKPYFLQVEDGTDFQEGWRRVNIYNDNMVIHQYYYSRDGKEFNETFEVICKDKSKSKSKSASKSKSRSSSSASSRSSRTGSSVSSISKSASRSSSASRSLPSLRSVSDSVYLTEPVKKEKNEKIGKKTTLDKVATTKNFGGKKSKKSTRKKRA